MVPTRAGPRTWHVLRSHLLSFPVGWDSAFSEPTATHTNAS